MNALGLMAAFALAAGAQPAGSPPENRSPAQAQQAHPNASPNPLAAMHKTCAPDFAKQCPNMGPGTPELRTCVQEHFSDLSAPCQTAIQAALAAGAGG